MSKTILSILGELGATSSITEKVAILGNEKNNATLKQVFQAAYNPMISYYIKKIPNNIPKGLPSTVLLSQAITSLSVLSSRELTGNAGIQYLTNILNQLHQDDATVIERIIERDLRCGTSDTLASRVWPGLVPTFDVMLAHKDISGIKYPAFAQIKSDGARCHMSLQAGKAVAFSRSGKEIVLRGVFDYALRKMVNEGETLDGELIAVKDGKVLDRKTGNGIINKAIKGTISEDEAKMLVFASWDIVDFTSTIPYNKRIERLTKMADSKNSNIWVLQTSIVNNELEATSFFEQCLAACEEGAMIKNTNSFWVPKRSKDIGKMKAEEVADLKIVGLKEGTGKFVGMLGAFECETSDGKLQVNVAGMSDALRKEFWDVKMIGRVIEVIYNQLITDKKTGMSSLFLPRFHGLREDKFVANTIGELK